MDKYEEALKIMSGMMEYDYVNPDYDKFYKKHNQAPYTIIEEAITKARKYDEMNSGGLKGTINYDFSDIPNKFEDCIKDKLYHKAGLNIIRIHSWGDKEEKVCITLTSINSFAEVILQKFVSNNEQYQQAIIQAINAWKGQFK